jgi:hypothetical protein
MYIADGYRCADIKGHLGICSPHKHQPQHMKGNVCSGLRKYRRWHMHKVLHLRVGGRK